MRAFSYDAPPTLEEAISRLGRNARPLAGGTDLLTLMKPDLYAPERLVAVRPLLPRGVTTAADGTTIGAATVLREVAASDVIARRYTALGEAAETAASLQLRNMATLGGNLLQRPRCWYFRNRHIPCWLKGGEECPAREGENRQHAVFGATRCVAVHPSDLAPALLAFDAVLSVAGPLGRRTMTLDELYRLPEDTRRVETTLSENDLIVAVRLPVQDEATRSIYLKAMDRAAFSFALAGVAAVVRLGDDNRRIARARLVLSGVAPIPWRAQAAEAILAGAEPKSALFSIAADAALRGAMPLRQNGWKVPLLRSLIVRALERLTAKQNLSRA
jgi:xanthine dehydrogenase YagS FAD-binding subunit